MSGTQTLEAPVLTILRVEKDVRLRHVAQLNARIELELAAGARHIAVCGAQTMSDGSRWALTSLQTRLSESGIRLEFNKSISSAA